MRLRITIAMLEIRNRKTLQSKVNICKSDVKIGDYADSLAMNCHIFSLLRDTKMGHNYHCVGMNSLHHSLFVNARNCSRKVLFTEFNRR